MLAICSPSNLLIYMSSPSAGRAAHTSVSGRILAHYYVFVFLACRRIKGSCLLSLTLFIIFKRPSPTACRQFCGDYRGAVELFTKVIKIQPMNARAFFRRGLAWRSLGEYTFAADDLLQAKRLAPNEPSFYVDYKRLDGIHVIELARPGDEDHV